MRLKEEILSILTQIFIEFQFLLVRLKVIVAPKRVAEHVISIPFGAIKSFKMGKWRNRRTEFQFLLVRLKVLWKFLMTVSL